MVNVPASVATSGRRERHFHKTRDLAKEHAAKLRQDFASHGAGSSSLKPSLAEDATRAIALLKPYDASLTDAAKAFVEEVERRNASKTIEEAGEAWQASMDGLRERSIRSYRVTLNRLIEALSGRLLSTLSADELSEAIGAKNNKPATRALHRRNVRAFWYWCAKQGWCDKSLFEKIEPPRRAETKQIAILTPEEAECLLRTAERYYPQAVSRYAVALFAGVRAAELKRLQAYQVRAEGIELSEEVAKTGSRRHITPGETLREWLAVYPWEEISRWTDIDAAVRRLAGWDVSSSLLKNPPTPTRGKWPQNCLRHSNATYSLNFGVPIETLLFEFGHVGGVDLLKRHYLGRATKQQAEAFFSMRPQL
ncbi:hypothetical protein AAFN60_13985 [Roseibacillus persicicus]|uniref:tyrosine-type recombinase/integrase n=1 Tax=Roseibacillus persicicus TaxID=454148 RepID=UPI00398A99EB